MHPVACIVGESAHPVVITLQKPALVDVHAEDELSADRRESANEACLDEVDAESRAGPNLCPLLRRGKRPEHLAGERNAVISTAGPDGLRTEMNCAPEGM